MIIHDTDARGVTLVGPNLVSTGPLEEKESGLLVRPVATERRRSYRIDLALGLPAELEGVGPARLVGLSLGGGFIETERKLQPGSFYPLLLEYKGSQAFLKIAIYRSFVHDLFYSANGPSKVQFRSRVRFSEPTIETLNTLYRILNDHWTPLLDGLSWSDQTAD